MLVAFGLCYHQGLAAPIDSSAVDGDIILPPAGHAATSREPLPGHQTTESSTTTNTADNVTSSTVTLSTLSNSNSSNLPSESVTISNGNSTQLPFESVTVSNGNRSKSESGVSDIVFHNYTLSFNSSDSKTYHVYVTSGNKTLHNITIVPSDNSTESVVMVTDTVTSENQVETDIISTENTDDQTDSMLTTEGTMATDGDTMVTDSDTLATYRAETIATDGTETMTTDGDATATEGEEDFFASIIPHWYDPCHRHETSVSLEHPDEINEVSLKDLDYTEDTADDGMEELDMYDFGMEDLSMDGAEEVEEPHEVKVQRQLSLMMDKLRDSVHMFNHTNRLVENITHLYVSPISSIASFRLIQ